MSLLVPWPLRALWLVLPVVAGPAVADAFADASRPVQTTSAVMAWGLWGLGLAALLVPRTLTLTVARVVVPGAVALVGWAAVTGDEPAWAAAGLVVATAALLVVLSPDAADLFVDGSSYGDERRVALRVPAGLGLLAVPVAWAALAAGVVTGPLLLAAGALAVGGAATVVGVVVAGAVAVRLHVLSRRWLVFVPAGVVVHDPLALAEPILFQRHHLRRIGPAPVDSDALDVTGGALGLALEVRSVEPVSVGLRRGRDTTETTGVVGLLVTPGRPASTLELARDRRLPVG